MTGVGAARREGAAHLLLTARRTGRTVPPLSAALPGLTLDDAYDIQQRQVDRWTAEGARVTGRKIGLTSVAVQRQLGVDQPDFGALLDRMAVPDGGSVAANSLLQPKIEAEVALVLGRDLDSPDCTREQLLAAVDHCLPALEIVDSRIADWNIGLVDTVADNASSGLYVLGTPARPLDGLDLSAVSMTLYRDGNAVSAGSGADCLGDPLNAALWLARELARRGTPLRRDDTVLTGALGPMVAVRPGDVFEARFSRLGTVRVAFDPTETEGL